MFTEQVATEYRDWANTDHELYDAIAIGMHAARCDARAGQPGAVVRVRGARQGDTVDRILSIFGESLDAALDARARGELAVDADGAMSHHAAG